VAAVGVWLVREPRVAAVGAWLVLWAQYSRRRCLAGPLGTVWPPWGVAHPLGFVWPPCKRGLFSKPSLAAVGAWPVPYTPYGRRGGVACPFGPVWPP